ncbi:MAG: hypothetical protein COX65_07320 [Elusimicrobia bacterium CG_4_10_14_0_2_um_filter_56_8]|nr:MAG: hypothetical protein AUJ51_04695 [Elusimicrobia bacterium CG1_02_56_21]PJA13360.1 MAG: hypothetical protein COX65_07320 [Elusimicrobia bacterium CG_4_10_14_0_2_um_filter_56_8]
MRYWAYIDKKVCGPFETEKLTELPAFNSSSLLCPDTPAGGQANDWKEASSYPEVLAVLNPAPEASKAQRPAADSPLLMTMRGSLIEAPAVNEPAAGQPEPAKPVPAAEQPRTPASSPLLMTMRGSLIEGPEVKEPAAEPLASVPPGPVKDGKPAASDKPRELPKAHSPAEINPAPVKTPQGEPDLRLQHLNLKIDQIGAMMASLAEEQSRAAEKMKLLESSVREIKELLLPLPPKA